MRYITEQELRDVFLNGIPDRYEPPADAKLTPAARQYLMDLKLYHPGQSEKHAAKTPAGKKPEHMTHLTSTEWALKSHPRIVLRGKLDSLEAEILLAQISAQNLCAPGISSRLEEALALVRRILASEVKSTPLGGWSLDGISPQRLQESSHRPQEFGFAGHILPAAAQGEMAALMNRLRTQVRETELAAVAAFCQGQDACSREDILMALNRLSSYFYILQLRCVKEREG